MPSQPVVSAKLTANVASFVAGMRAASVSMGGVKSGALSLGKAMAALSTVGTVIGAGLVKQFSEFQKTMVMTGAITQSTSRQYGQLSEMANQLGASTMFTATEAAEGMNILAKAGFSTQQVLAGVDDVLDLAAASGMSMADAAGIAISAMSTYNKTAEDMGGLNDVMVKTFLSTNTTLEDLGQTLKMVAPVANMAGIKFSTLNAAIGLLGNAGIKGTRAGTAMRQMILSLIKVTPQAQAVLDRLGIKTKDSSGKLRDFTAILDDLAAAGASTEDLARIFTARALPAVGALASKGGAAMRALGEEIENTHGIARRLRDIQMQSFAGQMNILKSKAQSLAIEFGHMLAPAVAKLATMLGNLVDWFKGLDPAVKASIAKGLVLTTVIAGLGAGVIALVTALSFLYAAISPLLLPLALLTGAILQIGLIWYVIIPIWKRAFSALSSHFVKFKDFMIAAFSLMKEEFFEVLHKMSELFDQWGKSLEGTWVGAFLDNLRFIKNKIEGEINAAKARSEKHAEGKDTGETQSLVDQAMRAYEKAKTALADGAVTAGGFLKNAAADAWANLKEAVKKAGDMLPKPLKKVLMDLLTAYKAVGTPFGQTDFSMDSLPAPAFGLQNARISTAWNRFTHKFSETFDKIISGMRPFAVAIADKFDGLLGSITSDIMKAKSPEEGAALAIADMVASSDAFKAMMTNVNMILQEVSNELGELLKPIMPVITLLFQFARALLFLDPILQTTILLMQKSEFVFRALFDAIKFLAVGLLKVVRWVFKALGRSTRQVDKQLKELRDSTYDTINDVDDLGKSAAAAANALYNVPVGVKIAAARFRAISTETAKGPAEGPGGGFLHRGEGPTGGTAPTGTATAQGAATSAGQVFYVQHMTVQANDPTDLLRKVEKEAKRKGVLRTGTLPFTNPFTTNRGG